MVANIFPSKSREIPVQACLIIGVNIESDVSGERQLQWQQQGVFDDIL